MGEAVRRNDKDMQPACPLCGGESQAAILLDFAGDRLAPDVARKIGKHVEECGACREFVESQAAVWNALDVFEAMPVSDHFDARLYARLEQQRQKGWLPSLWDRLTAFDRSLWRPLVPAAAALMLAAGLYFAPDLRQPDPNPEGTKVSKAEPIDAEQLESTLEDLEMLRQLAVSDPDDSQEI